MKIFHIVFDQKGLYYFKDFLNQNKDRGCYHILMINSKSLYHEAKNIENVELISDFDTAADKLISSDKVLIW